MCIGVEGGTSSGGGGGDQVGGGDPVGRGDPGGIEAGISSIGMYICGQPAVCDVQFQCMHACGVF